jgi:vacuolar-type H+-ATPase subunit H
MTSIEGSGSPLEVIRRKEAEIKRRLAAQREAGEVVLAEAELRAREIFIAAEAEGRRVGEAQRQADQAEAEREAQSIVARAHAEAERLQRGGQLPIDAAVARAVAMMIGGAHEA